MKRRGSQLSAWLAAAIVSLLAPRAASSALPQLPESFVVQEGGWLRLEYPPEARAKIPALLDEADSARAELSAALGRPVLWQARARLANHPADLAMLSPEPLSTAVVSASFADYELVLISLEGPAHTEVDLASSLRRELASLALHEATSGRLPPAWFAAGFASTMTRSPGLFSSALLISATVRGKLLPLSSLDRTLETSSPAPLAALQSRDFVHFLRAKGPISFAAFIERLRQGEPFPAALEGAYAEPMHQLERGWRERATTRYGYFPVLSAIGFVGALTFGISSLRAARRRRQSEEAESDTESIPPEPMHESTEASPKRVRLVVRRRSGDALTIVELEVPKVQYDGRWHTLH